MSKPRLLYVHGFTSSGSTLKGQALKRRYGHHFEVCTPTWPQHDPHESARFLLQQLEGVRRGVVVGSSLGGFYARWLGVQTGWPVVLINPALDLRCIDDFHDGEHVNPYTGERVRVDENWRAALADYRCTPQAPALVLLCHDDKVVRPDCALEQYGGIGEILLLPEGGHACWPLDAVWPTLDGFLVRQELMPECPAGDRYSHSSVAPPPD